MSNRTGLDHHEEDQLQETPNEPETAVDSRRQDLLIGARGLRQQQIEKVKPAVLYQNESYEHGNLKRQQGNRHEEDVDNMRTFLVSNYGRPREAS